MLDMSGAYHAHTQGWPSNEIKEFVTSVTAISEIPAAVFVEHVISRRGLG